MMWYLILFGKTILVTYSSQYHSDIHFVQGLRFLGCQTLRLDLQEARTAHSSDNPWALIPLPHFRMIQ